MPVSDTQITLYGFNHLIGKTVQACIGGLDCGDYTVSTSGSITVPFESDPQDLFTPQYLLSLDGFSGEQAATIQFYVDDVLETVTAPVVVGQGYTSRGQVLRALLPRDLNLKETNGLGYTRRSHAYAVLLTGAAVGALSFGTDFDGTMDDADLRDEAGEDPLVATSLFEGIHYDVLEDGYSFNSMVCWEVTRPLPATVNAITAFVVAEP